MKKLFRFTVSILILSAVGCTCFFVGNSIGKDQKGSLSTSVKSNEIDDLNLSIAVVNLDEGTTSENTEKIYYGEKVIQFPDESFVYTSLEDARRGIENKNYSAYIIIPSTFSESIESLNSTPTQANLKYALNTDLTGETQTNILYKVLKFGESLNTDLSYMYLANILQEFHQAQDDANTIMTNDIKDKEAIEQVQATDLVEMVPIPELEREENTLTTLDVTEYITTNSNLVNNIDEEYKADIDDSMEQVTNLSNNGKTLSETLNNLSDNIGQVNLKTDEKGSVVYEKGIQSLANNLSEFNVNLQTSKTDTLTEADKLEEQRSYIATALNTSIEKYNVQLSNEISNLLSTHKSDLNASIQAITCSEVDGSDGKKYEITCNTIEGEDIPPVVTISIVSDDLEEVAARKECLNAILSKFLNAKEETENKDVTLESEVTDSETTDSEETDSETTDSETTDSETTDSETTESETTDSETTDSETTDSETTDSETTDSEATDSETTDSETTESETTDSETTDSETTDSETTDSETTDSETTESETTDSETTTVTVTGTVEVNKSVATTLEECDADTDLLQKINECGYSNTTEFLSNVIDGNVILEPSTHMEIEGNIDELETYIKLGMEHVETDDYQITAFAGKTFDENGENILDYDNKPITVSTLLESYADQLQGINPKISLIAELNAQSVKDIVNNDCITPLLTRTEKVKNIFEQRYTNEVSEIGIYQELLAGYNPVKDTSKIEDYVSQMETNGTAMQDNIRDNHQEYVDFTEKVYTTTEENLNTLESHIEEAKETSENAVANGLVDAKSAKVVSSQENQQMMEDFASKLPYTRLGSMEYIQAYEFIANPLNLAQVSNYQRLKDDVSIQANSVTKLNAAQNQYDKKESYKKWVLYLLLGVLVVAAIINLVLQKKKNRKSDT